MTTPDAILDFWFGAVPLDAAAMQAREPFWFEGGADEGIRERFSAEVEAALGGALSAWEAQPRSRLALVLLLDQFTRNLFRGTGRAFAGDAHAVRLAVDAVDRGWDRPLSYAERAFLYMPLMHAEDRALQAKSVACFGGLARDAPADLRDAFAGFLDYARRHQAIVERFGHFPHRNALIGRATPAVEAEFLTQPGSSF